MENLPNSFYGETTSMFTYIISLRLNSKAHKLGQYPLPHAKYRCIFTETKTYLFNILLEEVDID